MEYTDILRGENFVQEKAVTPPGRRPGESTNVWILYLLCIQHYRFLRQLGTTLLSRISMMMIDDHNQNDGQLLTAQLKICEPVLLMSWYGEGRRSRT
jgi:hypothetical protein